MTDSINAIDDLMQSTFPEGGPGAALLVADGDDVLLRKGYGLADLELDIPIAPEMVFRIGSVTKQFTAVSIMMLLEQGKLNITDPLADFDADYPRGDEITVEHLLTHTSGIRNYTAMPEFATTNTTTCLWRR
jgi:D-alanyl-D-alanine carboxypeptidase